VFREILHRNFDDFTYWVYPALLACLGEMTMGIACACMPATAGFLKQGNGGQRLIGGIFQIFGLKGLQSRWRKGSDPLKRSKDPSPEGKPGNIVART
jgi:hypothetical protein